MKKFSIVLWFVLLSANCFAEEPQQVDVPPAIQAEIVKLGCYTCHDFVRTKFGPAWRNVADRYRGRAEYIYKGFNLKAAGEPHPLKEGLVLKVSKGGRGEWNDFIPMTPNDPKGIHQKEITDIVDFILSIPPQK